MKKILLSILLLTYCISNSQVATTPSLFEVNQSITITVDTNSTATDCNGFSNPTKVYMHSGIGDDSDAWGFNVIGNWGQDDGVGEMISNGDGTWSITITPETYYALNAAQAATATKMGMVFRNENGSQEFKDNGCSDFFFDVGVFQLTLTSPSVNPTILNSGDNLTISATVSIAADFVLTANGTQINSSTTASTSYSYTHTNITQNTSFQLQATNGGDTQTKNFEVVIRPTVIEQAVPAGMLDGINLDPADNTKATLVLYAPLKEFVHLIGDFNNWQIDDAFLMKKDSSQDRFWIELTGLTPQFNHLYQYLVEFDINIADPYSTLILDGFGNDNFIDATTYPDLPVYPSGQSHAITVLRTGDSDYVWQTTNFQKPKKTDLIIYKLLIRDFDELHSFDAVKNRLDYLQDLGINAIELLPVNEFDGNESWGYNPSFHMGLDKYYGTKDALKGFIDECHARGIAVFMDVVYNHATGQHPFYRMWNTDNGGTGGQATAESPFFNAAPKHAYNVFNDFNHQNQATRDYVNRVVTYLIEEFKIDGMRWDLTKGFTQNCSPSDENCTNSTQQDRITVLKGYADTQWASDPDFYVIFEHLGGIQEEEQWANYRVDEGKGIMLWNKQTGPYNEATLGYHDGGKSNFSGVSYVQKGFSQPSAVSYMESHDEERLMYRNLEFGNSDGDYNVKDLNTALSRMQTAGSFFFTVPGPKMMWQFGELGYDISIDYNGRTGNKPIKWEYADDPNRKALYDLWSKLIDLKINEPIFETTDFVLDLSNSTGLKKIKLTLDSATGVEIKYVTIIGNFGVTQQEINPDFQETGVWYEFLNGNLKFIVTDTQEVIPLEPGEFRIFGNNPTSLLPNENVPDDDSDGVENASDICPNTPLGATVDVTGCEIFSIPVENFTLKSFGETCRSSNNGSISITAVENYDYTAALSGDGQTSNNFTAATEFSDLVAGNYTVCITIEGQTGYEQCFNVTITEPEDLSVSSKVDTSAKSVSLNLKGGTLYTITLNEKTFTTADNEITLDLTASSNKLMVKTDKDCQGVYEETILLSGQAMLYPNPIRNNKLNIALGQRDLSQVNIELFEISGRMILSETYQVIDGNIEMDMSQISNGLFLLKIHTDQDTLHYKLIK